MAAIRSTGPVASSRPRSGPASASLPDVAALEAGSHRPEVQRVIREWIRRGVIRVAPYPGSRWRVRLRLNVPGGLSDDSSDPEG
ncbi:MAG: hypothetical protein U0794_10995 [Isosphaeraceae bacterium]